MSSLLTLLRVAWYLSIMLALPAHAAGNSICPGIVEVFERKVKTVPVCPTLDGEGHCCPAGQKRISYSFPAVFDCVTAGSTSTLYRTCSTSGSNEWPGLGGPSGVFQTGCGSESATQWVMETCDQGYLPKSCEGGVEGSGTNHIGDPVVVTTGASQQTVTDIDLGGSLAFRRHYDSSLHRVYPGSEGSAMEMGRNWLHSLDWRLKRPTAQEGSLLLVIRPLRPPVAFYRAAAATTFTGSSLSKARVSESSGIVTFVNDDGTRVTFGADDKVTEVAPPGERPIAVQHDGAERRFIRGSESILLTLASGRIASMGGGGETWTYSYQDGDLTSVVSPDPGASASSVTTTYSYKSTGPRGLLESATRASSAGSQVLGEWTYNGDSKVQTAEERALEEKIELTYSGSFNFPQSTSIALDASPTQILGSFAYETGRVTSTSGIGGLGVAIPFSAASLETLPNPSDPNNPIETSRWRTVTDLDGHTTLYENYAANGAPGRVVDGWVDEDDDGVLSAADTFERYREIVWHPNLRKPLQVREISPLTGSLHVATEYDYGTPPGDRLEAIIETGMTLDANEDGVEYTYTTTYTYHANGQIETITGPRADQKTTFEYDTSGRRTKMKRRVSTVPLVDLETTYSSFDSRGNPQTITDPNGRTTEVGYDRAGRVRSVRQPWEGSGFAWTRLSYDLDGNLTTVELDDNDQGALYTISMGYDAKQRLRFVKDSTNDAIVYEYLRGGRSREARYRDFQSLTDMGTLVGETNFEIDAIGRVAKAFTSEIPGTSVYRQFTYSDGGDIVTERDEKARNDNFLYSALDRLKRIDELSGSTPYSTEVAYDSRGDVSRVTDRESKWTDYHRDDRGRLVRLRSLSTGVTLFVYDPAGNLVQKVEDAGTGRANRSTLYQYDGLNRLRLVDYPTDPDWVYTYDTDAAKNQKGRLARVSNGVVATAFEYDPRGKVSKEATTIDGKVFEIHTNYDVLGRVSKLRSPSGVETTPTYVGLRPREVRIAAEYTEQKIRNLEYVPFGPRTRAEFPPNDDRKVVSTRSYNLQLQPSEIDVTGPGGLVVLDRSYRYGVTTGGSFPNDPGPLLDQVIDHRDASESRYFFYDNFDRLEKATNSAGTSLVAYGYDVAGNRTSETSAEGAFGLTYEMRGGFDTDNLESRSGPSTIYYENDAFGNRMYQSEDPYAGVPLRRFDESNRLIEARDSSTQSPPAGTYIYDAFGRRVKKTTGLSSTLFFYHPSGELLEQVITQSGFPDYPRRYVFVEGELLATVDQEGNVGSPAWVPGPWFEIDPDLRGALLGGLLTSTSAMLLLALHPRRRRAAVVPVVAMFGLQLTNCGGVAVYSWVHTDHLGTPLAVTNTPPTPEVNPPPPKVIWRASYAPFGKATVDADPDGDFTAFPLHVRFPGQYFDSESGYHYNYYRDYDPTTGRFIEADPIGQSGGINVYEYALNSPTATSDPDGLTALAAAGVPGVASAIGGASGVGGGVAVASGLTIVGVGAFGGVVGVVAGALIEPYVTPIVQEGIDAVVGDPLATEECEPTEELRRNCYARYQTDVFHCGAYYTDDRRYDRCMQQAWKNYIRCINGLPPLPTNTER